MCIAAIVDADVLHKVLASRKGEGDPLFRSWIRRRHGLLVHATTDLYLCELRNNKVMDLLGEYRRGQHLKLVSDADIASAEQKLQGVTIRSNDLHMLVLALASDALVLCSCDDKFRDDFQDERLLPKVGKRPRKLYPIKGSKRQRNQFLNRRKCPDRR